ncbi:MAG: hypothetical protein RIM23_12900 [Coleofasciculus sp. G3-WIS-01]|uniref:hypothetical protein n=1 Tax=Coleofasciculus sp. G3-WIS-01 TaxID=3069528 RepID=UPI0032FE702B
MIRAQHYIYNQSDIEICLIGSSMMARLNPEDINKNKSINLSMIGQSSQTGLEILKRNQKKPSIVIVEINGTIQRGIDQEFISELYNKFQYLLRLYFPVFREEYKPISTLVSYLKRLKNGGNEDEETEILNPEIREKILKQMIQEKNYSLSEEVKEKLTKEANYIKHQIQFLQNQGVKIFLADIPQDQEIQQTISEQQTRKLLKKILSPDKFYWIPDPISLDLNTTDGIHLDDSSAKAYTHFLKDQVL